MLRLYLINSLIWNNRGYVCFDLFRDICGKGAGFVIRGKSNHVCNVLACFLIDIPERWKDFPKDSQDIMVTFRNDRHCGTYRIASFTVFGENFVLITSRYDLKTYQIVMLYAHRWQVGLIFRFLKRTPDGIHLMSHRAEGTETQFILYMIAYLLLLAFGQECMKSQEDREEDIVTHSGNVSEKDSSSVISDAMYS